jgi:hypothetical protein
MKVNDFLVEAPAANLGPAGNFLSGALDGVGDHESAALLRGDDKSKHSGNLSKTEILDTAKKIFKAWIDRQKNLDARSLKDLGYYQSELDRVIGEELSGYAPAIRLASMSQKHVQEYITDAVDGYNSQQGQASANELDMPQGAPGSAPAQNAQQPAGARQAPAPNAPQQAGGLLNPPSNLWPAFQAWKQTNPAPEEKQAVKAIFTEMAGTAPKTESRIITRGKVITNEDLKRVPFARRKLYEGLTKSEIRTVILWENIGLTLNESNLTTAQLDQVFQQVEQELTTGGDGIASNRTMLGKGKDVYDTVEKAVNELGKAAQNTALVKGFDNLYDSAAEKLKQATGGDQGVMQYIQKYREFAKAHPALQNLFYTALIIGTGLATGGAGGPIIAGVFKSVDRMLQGDKLSAALAKGTTTGIKSALVAGAKNLAKDALSGMPAGGGAKPDDFAADNAEQVPANQTLAPGEEIAQPGTTPQPAGTPEPAGPAAQVQQTGPTGGESQATSQSGHRLRPSIDQQFAASQQQAPAWTPSVPQQFNFTPAQQQWLGSADMHDPYIISRMPDNLGPKPPMEFFDPKDMTPGMKQAFKPAAQMNYSAPAPAAVDPNDWRQKAMADYKAGRPGTPAPGYVPPHPQGGAPQFNPQQATNVRYYDPNGMVPGDKFRPGYGVVDQPHAARGTYNSNFPTEPIMDPNSPYATPRAGTTGPRYRDPRNFFQDKWSDGYQVAGIALSESQIRSIFYRVELRSKATDLVNEGAWDTIKKGLIDPAEKKVKQFGKNLTTKVTADKLHKAWAKGDMPTDPEGLIDFLVKQKVNRAVAEKVVGQVAGTAPQPGTDTQPGAAPGAPSWGYPSHQAPDGTITPLNGQGPAQGGQPGSAQAAPAFSSQALKAEWDTFSKSGDPDLIEVAREFARQVLNDPWWNDVQGQPAKGQTPPTPVQFPAPQPAPVAQAPAGQPPGASPAAPQGRFAAADKITNKQEYFTANRKAADAAAKAAKAAKKMPTQGSADPTSPAASPKKESKMMSAMLEDFVKSLNK